MECMIILISLGVLFTTTSLVTLAICHLSDFIHKKKIEKSQKEFPNFYNLVQKHRETNCKLGEIYRKKQNIKKEIDKTLIELNYLIPSEKEKTEKKLNDLRFDLWNNESTLIELKNIFNAQYDEILNLKEEIEKKGGKVF